jgi:hypothetical protein
MALSPSSRHRSRLIREMSRDLNRTNHSVASSTGSHHGTVSDSTISDFDPENEAIMSTRQLDNSQRLPELRDTAKKYGRWSARPQQDFVINTSAIGRAFPDFSQGGSSDDSMEIEVGRGAKTRQRTPSKIPRAESSDTIDSPAVKLGEFEILSTPPGKSNKTDGRRSIGRSSKRDYTPLKENVPPRQPSAMRGDYISGASRTTSGQQRRTLAELHARVTDDTESSFIDSDRPATVTFAAKTSRFANGSQRGPSQSLETAKKAQANDILRDAIANRRNATPAKAQADGTNNITTPMATQQSFLLPNIPDLSELVSGTFKNGTPVFTRSGKVQSRFSTNGSAPAEKHHPIDGIPVPEEEKAIFLSLQILQDRVSQLETEKAEEQRLNDEFQQRVFQLEAEKAQLERNRRSDSALGMADSGSDGDYARGKNFAVEKTSKLFSQNISLHVTNMCRT